MEQGDCSQTSLLRDTLSRQVCAFCSQHCSWISRSRRSSCQSFRTPNYVPVLTGRDTVEACFSARRDRLKQSLITTIMEGGGRLIGRNSARAAALCQPHADGFASAWVSLFSVAPHQRRLVEANQPSQCNHVPPARRMLPRGRCVVVLAAVLFFFFLGEEIVGDMLAREEAVQFLAGVSLFVCVCVCGISSLTPRTMPESTL